MVDSHSEYEDLRQQAKACLQNGNYVQAVQFFQKMLQINPDDAQIYYLLGTAFHHQNKLKSAIESYTKSIELNPNNGPCLCNIGVCYYQQGMGAQTIKYFTDAIKLTPDDATIHNNFGFILYKLSHFDEAELHLLQATKLNPSLAVAYTNLGNLMRKKGQWSKTVEFYTKALALDENDFSIYSDLYYAIRTLCRWDILPEYESKMLDKSKILLEHGNPSPIDPFVAVFLPIPIKTFQQIVNSYAKKQRHPDIHTYQHAKPTKETLYKPLRIGYVSAAFRRHATTHLAESLFELHDRENFEIYAYAVTADDESKQRHKIEADCDVFRDMSSTSNEKIAKQIYEDKIQILIDVDGYTEHNRHDIFAYQPAPIQVNYLGYPGTLGTNHMQYIIADPITLPKEYEQFYNEKPARLPHCYQINNHKKIPIAAPPKRIHLGLPENGFVFCCFNITRKIDPTIFDVWMKILSQVDGSVLWLLSDSEETTKNLHIYAEEKGISAKRIITTERCDIQSHLAREQCADLFLDTLHCNAHTTASDALWGELPIITCPGETFANRIAASIVNAAGIPELIVENLKEYETLAVDLATDKNKFNQIKTKLAKNKHTCPLFDTPQYVRDMERLYTKMWQQYVEQKPLQAINLLSAPAKKSDPS